jgi:hypothetical protein
MSKEKGDLIEAVPVLTMDKTVADIHTYFLSFGAPDGFVVTNPEKFFGGLWVFIDTKTINKNFVYIGEV